MKYIIDIAFLALTFVALMDNTVEAKDYDEIDISTYAYSEASDYAMSDSLMIAGKNVAQL